MLEILRDKMIMIFLIIVIAALVGGGIWFYMNGVKKTDAGTATNNSLNITATENKVVDNQVNANSVNETVTANNGIYINLSSWCGKYVNKETGKSFVLYQGDLFTLRSDIFDSPIEYSESTKSLIGTSAELGGETISSIAISRLEDGSIDVKAATKKAQSDLASYTGTYKKEEYASSWNGIYKSSNGGIYIILSETTNKDLFYTIVEDISAVTEHITEYTTDEIQYTGADVSKGQTLNILKTETGIIVQAKAEGDSTDLYNKISGEYTKMP